MSSSFARVVRSCLRYRMAVASTIACAIAVGVLWGANIGTVFPFVEVVFQGKSLPDWVDEEVHRAEQRIAAIDQRGSEADRVSEVAGRDASSADGADSLADRRKVEVAALRGFQRLQPVIHQYLPTKPFPTLVVLLGVLIVGTLVKAAFLAICTILTERIAQAGTIRLRTQFFHHVLSMPIEQVQADDAGQLVSRATFDLEQVTVALRTLFGRTLREPLKMVACLVGAAWVCWRLLLVSMVLAPLFGWLISKLNRSVKRANAQALDEMSGIHAVLTDSLRGLKQLKAFTMEPIARRRFTAASRRYLNRSVKVATVDAMIRPTIEVMTMGVVAVAVLVGGYLVLNEQTHVFGICITPRPMTISSLLLFFGLLAGVSDPARKLSGVIGKLQRGAAASERIYQVLDGENGKQDGRVIAGDEPLAETRVPASLARLSHSIEFRNVHFAYGDGPAILRGVDLTIERGETVAIVGSNGCGKSTLVSLLLRFNDPQQGSVRIDGQDLRAVRRRDLRRQIGLVSQDSILFSTTIEENIRFGNPEADAAMIRAAAVQARADDFIRNDLSDGYNTHVGDGGCRLSGGQRQRIALARAMIREPSILVLDEATSQVDLHSERQINQALADFIKDRTALMITHRPTALDLADRIIVMQTGRILDSGSYTELAERCELFRQLATSPKRRAA